MKLASGILRTLFATVALTYVGSSQAQAQLAGTNDGTNTRINQNGNTFNITGGTQAGANLFHSFQRFGLNQGQIANFLSNPSIQNILGRVTGGEVSVINGLLHVTGSNANLYLMNPAGIIFGPNASLNVSGSFLATTANGIGFDRPIPGSQGGQFNAVGTNDYSTLAGSPTSLAFTTLQPAAIVSSANLTVQQGKNLSLVGGTVTSTGQLSAPGGDVTVASVPGESLVRVSAAGQLLSVEVNPNRAASYPTAADTHPLSLAELITGGNSKSASGLTVNSDGTITLTGSGLEVKNGDVAVKSVTAKTATLSATNNLTLAESQLQTTNDLNLLAQNNVQVRDSVINPVLVNAGGNLKVHGNQGIDILALNHPNPAFQSGGNLSLISNGVVSGDAHFAAGGSFSILNSNGNSGTFVSRYDPIISASGNVTFGSYTGAALKVEATGSITVNGNIVINAPDVTLTPGAAGSDRETLRTLPALILRAGLPALQETTNVANPSTVPSFSYTEPTSGTTFNATTASSPKQISVNGSITTTPAKGSAGPVILAAPEGITVTGSINTSATDTTTPANGGRVSLTTTTGNIQVGDIQAQSAGGATPVGFGQKGSVILTSSTGNITSTGTVSNVNAVNVSTAGNVTFNNISGLSIDVNTSAGDIVARTIGANTINLTATGGGVTVGDPTDSTTTSLFGNSLVNVVAQKTIRAFGSISADPVRLTSAAGDVIVTTISAGADGVDISAAGLFQARGASTLPNVFLSPLLSEAPDIYSFLQAKGISASPNQRVTVGYGTVTGILGIPASINARQTTSKPTGSFNAPITIRFGGATRTLVDQQITIPSQNGNPPTVSRILIQGGNGAFYSGPAVAGRVVPGISDPFITRDTNGNFVAVNPSTFTVGSSQLYRNELYSTQFPSSQFPANISGTAGAIFVGFGSNQTLFGAVQNQPFNAINPGTGPGNGNTGNPGGNGGSSSGGVVTPVLCKLVCPAILLKLCSVRSTIRTRVLPVVHLRRSLPFPESLNNLSGPVRRHLERPVLLIPLYLNGKRRCPDSDNSRCGSRLNSK